MLAKSLCLPPVGWSSSAYVKRSISNETELIRLTQTDEVETIADKWLFTCGTLRLVSMTTRMFANWPHFNEKPQKCLDFTWYWTNSYLLSVWRMICFRKVSPIDDTFSVPFFIGHIDAENLHMQIWFHFAPSVLLLNLVIKFCFLFIGCCCIFDVALSKPTRSKRPTGTCSFSI